MRFVNIINTPIFENNDFLPNNQLLTEVKITPGENDGSIYTYDDGKVIYRNAAGEIHRDGDLPAAYDIQQGSREWYKNGKHHRDLGPATEYDNGGKSWYNLGLRHRIDGPAVDWKHTKKWFINGYEVTTLMNYYMKKYLITMPIYPSKPIVEELNRDKDIILKQIVTNIKDKHRSDMYLPLVHMFKKLGVTWPELDIIQKSGEASLQQLTENTNGNLNTSPKVKAAIDKLIDELTVANRPHYRAYAILDWLESRYTNDVKIADLAQALSTPKVMNIILDWIDGVINQNSFAPDILIHTLDRLAMVGGLFQQCVLLMVGLLFVFILYFLQIL